MAHNAVAAVADDGTTSTAPKIDSADSPFPVGQVSELPPAAPRQPEVE
jgi:hypothetical protein